MTMPEPEVSHRMQSSTRIHALDLMRGYLIMVIMSVHLAYYPSLFGSFDGRGQLWVSEAEGFFFISGLLIGLIRRRDIQRSGLKVASQKVLQRGLRLYLAGVVLTIIYLLWGRLVVGINPGAVKAGLDTTSSVWNLAYNILLLRYSYGWSDFLIFYAAFLFITPLVLWLLQKRLWWAVLAGTLSLWVWRWRGGYDPYSSFMQWQVYFFLGTLIGYFWNGLIAGFYRLSQRVRQCLQILAVSGMVLTTLGGLLAVFGPQSSRSPLFHWIEQLNSSPLYNSLLTDGRLGLLRPLTLLITFVGAFILVRRYEDSLMRRVGWLLLPFGKNSLYVYILGSLGLYTAPFITHAGNFWLNSALELGIIGIIFVAVRSRFLFKIIPR